MATKTAKTKTKINNKKKVDHTATKTFKYVVESGVQLTGVRHTGLLDKFPFEMMKVGDSFMIPESDPLHENINTLHYAAKQYAKMRPGFTVTTRLQLDKTRRVWRIK